MRRTAAVLAACVLVGAIGSDSVRVAHDAMAAAANAFLESLTPEQRGAARLEIDDEDRRDWHYIPRSRRGLALREMTDDQRDAARRLLQAALSKRGYMQADDVIGLETVLRIPESWNVFVYNGFLFVRGDDGRFVVRGKWKAKVA